MLERKREKELQKREREQEACDYKNEGPRDEAKLREYEHRQDTKREAERERGRDRVIYSYTENIKREAAGEEERASERETYPDSEANPPCRLQPVTARGK